MRESFGGLFMIQLLLIILFVVVAFAAIGLSIGKAFRIKNQIIDYVEQYEGCEIAKDGTCVIEDGTAGAKIDEYLNRIDYNNGYKVEEVPAESGKGMYYKIYVTANWSLPFVNVNNTSVLTSRSSNGSGGAWTISGITDLIR